jgi:hypothetical protein
MKLKAGSCLFLRKPTSAFKTALDITAKKTTMHQRKPQNVYLYNSFGGSFNVARISIDVMSDISEGKQ